VLPPLRFWQRNQMTRRQNLSRTKYPRIWIKYNNGRFEVPDLGAWHNYWGDPYHLLLTIPWPGFLLILVGAYVVVNAVFALGYLAGGDCIANSQPGSFSDAFFFSVQTLASIGYGAMYPATTYAHLLVTLEALTSILGIALMTGLAFARFSQPTAKVIFSQVAVIQPYNGTPTLMFRAGNQRRNLILEAKLHVYMLKDEISAEGEFMRRLYDLKLLRNHTPNFTLTWMAMHPIDETSPLHGMSFETMVQDKIMLIASLTGIDETVAQALHARQSYVAADILWNHRFADVIKKTSDDHRYLDFKYFNDTIPL